MTQSIQAAALVLFPLLSAIPADAAPLRHIEVATYCRSIESINKLPGNAKEKYQGCLANQRSYLRGLEDQWGSLNEEQQRRCVTQFVHEGGYLGLAWCVWEITRRTFR